MSPASARTQTARFGDKHTKHEATATPTTTMATNSAQKIVFELFDRVTWHAYSIHISNSVISEFSAS